MNQNQPKPHSFSDRIEQQKKRLQAEIGQAEPGYARDLERKLRQLDVAVHINEWLASPGLRAPR